MKGNERGKEREREERTEKKKMGYTGKEGDSGVRGKGNEEEEEEETSIRRKRRRKGGGKEEGSATFSKFRSWGVNFSILAQEWGKPHRRCQHKYLQFRCAADRRRQLIYTDPPRILWREAAWGNEDHGEGRGDKGGKRARRW